MQNKQWSSPMKKFLFLTLVLALSGCAQAEEDDVGPYPGGKSTQVNPKAQK